MRGPSLADKLKSVPAVPGDTARNPDEEYAGYDPVEGLPILGSNTEVAASGAKINTHTPTPEEIASRKYVVRRFWSGPRWVRWLFGTDEYKPK